MPDILTTLSRMRAAALRQDKVALEAIVRSYQAMYGRMTDSLEALLARIYRDGETPGKRYLADRLAGWVRELGREMGSFSTYLQTALPGFANNAAASGMGDAYRILRALSPAGTPVLQTQWGRLPREAINTILGFMQPSSTLWTRLEAMAPVYSKEVADLLVDAIAQGWGAARTARNIAPLFAAANDAMLGGMGKALTDALRTARTVQLWSYREAARANYVANNDVVTGWQWSAELDERTCMSCVAMHGTIHDLDETLDDHHNGRCAAIPIVLGRPLYDEDAGRKWFDGLSESQQAAQMGAEKYQAFRDGKFEFGALSRQVEDDVYKTMRSEASLKSLLGESE